MDITTASQARNVLLGQLGGVHAKASAIKGPLPLRDRFGPSADGSK